MGSFDETCAITRTTIHQGDPIVIVIYRDPVELPSTHNVGQTLWSILRRREQLKDAREEMRSWHQSELDYHKEMFKFRVGKYDGYGWVRGTDNPLEIQDFWRRENGSDFFMVHREVWDEIAGESVDLEGLRRLQEFAYMARIQLFWPDRLIGAQYGRTEHTWKQQEKVVALTRKIIAKQKENLL